MGLANVWCRAAGHRAPAAPVWNECRYFGACPRCARDLCRSERGAWCEIPRGYRVVWRARRDDDPPRWRGALAVIWDGSGRGGVARRPDRLAAPQPRDLRARRAGAG